jgi:hypothetical protein
MNKDTPKTNRFYASFADGECIPNQDEWLALCESLERELTAVTEQRDEARRLAERYRNLSCDSQEEADEKLLPWETTNPNEL